MNVVEINNPEEWDSILLSLSPEPSFLQSSAWGICLLEEGKSVRAVVVEEHGIRYAAALLVANNLPFGWRYGFCPGGPVFKSSIDAEKINLALAGIRSYSKKKKGVFLRIEPTEKFKIAGKKWKQVADVNPAITTVLDVTQSFEKLCAAMHKKTRYCLRAASESNLEIKNEKNPDIFLGLLKQTGERDDFRLHTVAHYAAILNSSNVIQITAYKDGVAIATAVWFGFAKTLTYLFAASDHTKRDLYAPYALQEAVIKWAQQNKFEKYDFFGIAPRVNDSPEYTFDTRHPYAGITTFKTRFGGNLVERPGTYDLIIHRTKYKIYKLLRFLRRMV